MQIFAINAIKVNLTRFCGALPNRVASSGIGRAVRGARSLPK